MSANLLMPYEQRGQLTYVKHDSSMAVMDGWFSRGAAHETSGIVNVVARRVRGRNRWQLCNIDNVSSFDLAGAR